MTIQNSKIIKCQNCQKEFTIEPEDFAFYEKIKVPPPTWCWLCRAQRRFIFRNEGILYKRKSDYSGKEIFSMFSPVSLRKVYEREVWFSDKWDPMKYGCEYDFQRSFFDQLKDLISEVPVFNLSVTNMINSPYCNNYNDAKNCFLVFGGCFSENCLYGRRVSHSKDCIDVSFIHKGELCYDSSNVNQGYKILFSIDCENSNEIYFSKNLVGCSNCFGCVNLRNKKNHIFNQPFSKEGYHQKLNEFNLGSYQSLNELDEKVRTFWLGFPQKYIHERHNKNVSGDYIFNSKNVLYSYNIKDAEDSKYCQNVDLSPLKNCYDYSYFGENAELLYENSTCGLGVYNLKFCDECWVEASDLIYCVYCNSNCNNLFGCVGLRHKQYCILNKQYTKEEYERMVPKIIEHMNKMPYVDKKGRVYKYGEFFPPELSPFAYNETIAQEYFPLTKEQALKQGYSWKDPEERDIKPDIKTAELPDHIKDVKDSIIGKVIQCAHTKLKEDGTLESTCNEQCTTAFKIIEPELQFYRRMNLPLPRLCPNCRHYQRLKQRNPLKLWHRKCMCGGRTSENGVYKNTIKHFHGNQPCPNEFETSYSPDRPEIVYCEKCYLAEVV